MALSLRSRLENDFEVSLPATLIFEQPNIESLAEYLLKEIQPYETSPTEKAPTGQPQSEPKTQDNINQQTDIEQLSVNELINIISNEFTDRQ